ncbi:MAG TPA: SDR family oxidoreductase [Bryobacteraceae bacterium]|jgi:NADP-dependent 3-hydroxy acid dehydrogenase YdfG|nr:SDR family oxidoreductase [Bryobacteraceae bacterium]
MAESLKGKSALVIGASSGIGRESAVLLARAGARVIASARRENALRALEGQMEKEGAPLSVVGADASKAADMQRLARQALEKLGGIDIVVYSAGTNNPDRSMARLTPGNWDGMIAANLNGAYYISDAVLPAMRKAGGGLIIFISSISALAPDVSGAAYQASKRGLHGLAGAIRTEEKEHGIRTCLICPGLVDTEILDKRPVVPAPEVRAKALRPEDVAEAVVFAASLPARAVIPEMQIVPSVI